MAAAGLYLRLDIREAQRVLGSRAEIFRKKGRFEATIARAQNAALDTARAETVRVIREEYAAPAGEIRRTMTATKATKRTLQARLVLRGRASAELVHYGARAGLKGVSVKVLKSSRKSVIRSGGSHGIMALKKRRAGSATWLAKGHVLARVKDKDHPLMLWGPSFLSRLSKDENRNRIMEVAGTRFRGTLNYLTNQALGRK